MFLCYKQNKNTGVLLDLVLTYNTYSDGCLYV